MNAAGGAAGGAAAAAHAAQIQAIRACGVLVEVEPNDFLSIVAQQDEPLILHAESGFFTTSYSYLVAHKGLAFFAKTRTPLHLPKYAQIILAKKIHIPG